MKKYIIDGQEFEVIPSHLAKDGFMRPVTVENFDIQEVEYEIQESPIVTAFRAELQSYIDSLNAKPEYAGLNLLITDAPEVALGKLKTAGVTWADSVPLDMLKRNLKDAEAQA